MLIASYIIPVIAIIALFVFFKHKVAWWEALLLLVSSVIITLLVYLISKEISQADVEYYGGYVTEIRHYDDWNERQRRTRQVPCGTDSKGHTRYRTETYWVTVYHPEKWTMFTNISYERGISKKLFNEYKKRLNAPEVFIDMHRHYYTKDGDAQSYSWDRKHETFIPYAEEHRYKNPFKNSHSILRYIKVDDDSAKVLGLYDYPEIKNYKQNPIIGYKADARSLNQINYVNGMYGKKYEFRAFILVFPASKGVEISELQKGYWEGGNKNEFIVCLGVDDTKHVKWCNAYSWSDAPWLDVETRSWFAEHDTLDLYEYGKWLERYVPKKWERKHFSDYDYIHAELTPAAKIVVFILTLLFCCGMCFWIVTNDFDEENKIWHK